MARGAAQTRRKRRPQPEPKKKRSAPSWEEQLFFSRLRRHAKVMYVLLALVFAVGFVAFGVGSGSNGLSDILNGQFFGGGGGGTSSQIKADQKKIAKNPNDIDAYLDLAGVYQQDQRNSEAVTTLKRALKLAPSNFDVLNQLAGIYRAQAEQAALAAQNAQLAVQQNNVLPPGLDASSTFGQAFSQDPLTQSLNTKLNQANSKAIKAFQTAENAYKGVAKAARGTSSEAGAQLQLGSLAASIQDTATAITAFKRYLKLAPNGTNAAAVRQTIRQLQAAQPAGQR
jgi:Tetratricopeptide repeat